MTKYFKEYLKKNTAIAAANDLWIEPKEIDIEDIIEIDHEKEMLIVNNKNVLNMKRYANNKGFDSSDRASMERCLIGRSGFVYLLHRKDGSEYKLGYSKDPLTLKYKVEKPCCL